MYSDESDIEALWWHSRNHSSENITQSIRITTREPEHRIMHVQRFGTYLVLTLVNLLGPCIKLIVWEICLMTKSSNV